MRKMKRKAQVWIETVIYTLIGLTIIGIILALAVPSIEKYKDELVVEQTMSVMGDLDTIIQETRDAGAGNRRIIPELRLKKGIMEFNSQTEEITYRLENTRLQYSEEGQYIEQGSLKISTEKGVNSKVFNLNITLSYPNLNLTFNGNDAKRIFTPASTSYRLSVFNSGTTTDTAAATPVTRTWIDFEEIS